MKIMGNYLSFMDVMSCGMGSLFFLFFLFVALKPEMQLDFFEKNSEKNKYENPLVVMISSSNMDNMCFPENFSGENWKLPKDYACATQNSPYYGVLYGVKMPSHGEIWVGPVESGGKIDIQIFCGSLQFRHRGIDPVILGEAYQNQSIRVWPIPQTEVKK